METQPGVSIHQGCTQKIEMNNEQDRSSQKVKLGAGRVKITALNFSKRMKFTNDKTKL